LHELDPGHEPPSRTLWRPKHLKAITGRIRRRRRPTRSPADRRLSTPTNQIQALGEELRATCQQLASALLAICGCSTLTAAKTIRPALDHATEDFEREVG
jgi:hypothetical protein